MLENKTAKAGAARRRTTHALRERLGGAPREAIERNQQRSRVRRRIVAALEQGSRTVPEIAEATALPAGEVLWHVMAMKKYGQVVEGPQQGDYYEYLCSEKRETRR